MKNRIFMAAAIACLPALMAGCFGGQPEESASIDINVTEDVKEIESMQKQIYAQTQNLQKMQQQLKQKKATGGAAASGDVAKLEKQIAEQQKVIVQASAKVAEVKVEKGKYVWSMFRGVSSHNFYNGYNIMPPLDFKWKYRNVGGFRGSPVMDAENIYVGGMDNAMHAIDKASGQPAWKTQVQGFVSSAPALYGGTLYFGTEGGMFYALSAKDGSIKWSKKAGPAVSGSSPAVISGNVIFGVADNVNAAEGCILALNRSTGEVAWKKQTNITVLSSPCVANGLVYIGCADGNLYALNPDSGTVAWQYTADKGFNSSPAEQGGTLVAGSDNKKIYGLDSLSGAVKWAFTAEGWITTGVIKDGAFFTGSKDKNVYAIDMATGKLLWKKAAEYAVLTAPLAVNDTLYVAAGKEFMALDIKSGEKKWSTAYETKIECSPIAEDGVVYFGDTDSSFYALESVAK